MKKKFFALMMAMVMVLSLAACGGSDEADSNSGDSAGGESSGSSAFKVGVIGPLTGGAAIYGTCVANSAQIAVDEINALGGDIQFELMTEDDVNDAETSVNAYNALMDDGMQILAGVAVAGEHRAQRIWRDLRVDRVSGGTDEMMILTASKFELKKYRD